MPTLPNMNLVLPTLGSDRNVWDAKVNTAFGLVDVHNHTSGKGVRVPVGGLNIDTDLPFGGNAATGLGKVVFDAVAALAAGSKALFVSSADNELYFRNNAGVNVKLTSGNGLNISLVGGIVGDYSTSEAEVAYDASGQRYTFKQGGAAPKPWARLASGPVRLYQHNTTETVYVEIQPADGLAVSYSLTLPAALPTEPALWRVNTDGTVVFMEHDAIDVDLGLTGEAKVNHGDYHLGVMPFGVADGSGVVAFDETSGVVSCSMDTTGGRLTIPIPLKPGDRVKKFLIAYTSPGGPPTPSLQYATFTTPYSLAYTAGGSWTSFGVTIQEYTVDTPEAMGYYDATDFLFGRRMQIRLTATSNTTVVYGVAFVYDSTTVPAV